MCIYCNARNLLTGLARKLNPATPRQADNLTLTHHRLEKNAKANIKRGDEVIFNPTVTTRTSLKDCFRVFVTQPRSDQAVTHPKTKEPPPPLTIYTDGSCTRMSKVGLQHCMLGNRRTKKKPGGDRLTHHTRHPCTCLQSVERGNQQRNGNKHTHRRGIMPRTVSADVHPHPAPSSQAPPQSLHSTRRHPRSTTASTQAASTRSHWRWRYHSQRHLHQR